MLLEDVEEESLIIEKEMHLIVQSGGKALMKTYP